MTLLLLLLFLSTCSVDIDVISVCTMAEADIHSLLSKNGNAAEPHWTKMEKNILYEEAIFSLFL